MLRETLINKTIESLSKLPNDKVREVSDFTEYILKKHEEESLQKGIEKLVSDSNTFQFLKDDEDLYTVNDIIEKY
jgi:argininosuccinate lyase